MNCQNPRHLTAAISTFAVYWLAGSFPFSAALAQTDSAELQARLDEAFRTYVAAVEAEEFEKARIAGGEAFDLGKQIFGEVHPNTATLQFNYAAALESESDWKEAEELYLDLLDVYDELYGEQSMEHIPVLMKLGGFEHTTTVEARSAYLSQALTIQGTLAPNDLPAYAALTSEAADLLSRTESGRSIARAMLEPLLDYMAQTFGADSPELVPILMSMGRTMANQYDTDDQVKTYRRAIELVESAYPDDVTLAASYALRAGRDLMQMSRSPRGRAFLEDAYEVFDNEYGPAHESTASARVSLGEMQILQDRLRGADDHLLGALEFYEGKQEFRSEEMQVRTLLIDLYTDLGDSEAAARHLSALNELRTYTGDQEYYPLTKVAPIYPVKDVVRGFQGRVIVQYTIDEIGRTRDHVVVESSGSEQMDAAAVESARQYRYSPRVLDGKAVSVPGVTTAIIFELAK